MLVNQVSNFQTTYKANYTNSNKNICNVNKSHSVDTVSFSGFKPNPEFIKNQYKIMLSQDIWADKLNIKLPESDMEKEVLLEILAQRLKLDRYTRLTNEKLRIMADLNRYNTLIKTDSKNPELNLLEKELDKRGNLQTVITTLNKNIALEKNKRNEAINYFKNIENLEDEYVKTHKISNSAISKFWYKIQKNNINKEHQYSTQDLIDIISGKKIISQPEATTKTADKTILSKKQILLNAQKEYEQYLREKVNIYILDKHWQLAEDGRKFVYQINEKQINKNPGIKKQIINVFEKIQNKYQFKTETLRGIDIYPVGDVWLEMNKGVAEMRAFKEQIRVIEEKINNGIAKKQDAIALQKAKDGLNETKQIWTDALKLSMSYERKNRQIFESAGKLDTYDYLTSENKEINCYKKLEKLCNENNGELPEFVWEELLG